MKIVISYWQDSFYCKNYLLKKLSLKFFLKNSCSYYYYYYCYNNYYLLTHTTWDPSTEAKPLNLQQSYLFLFIDRNDFSWHELLWTYTEYFALRRQVSYDDYSPLIVLFLLLNRKEHRYMTAAFIHIKSTY